jgi:aryl-alcohol dehydrogenase-like predicted oxidoreductase
LDLVFWFDFYTLLENSNQNKVFAQVRESTLVNTSPATNLSLGTSQMGHLDFVKAKRLIDFALQKGVIHFDTAPLYGNAEAYLGKCISPDRTDIQISTKFGLPRPTSLDSRSIEESIKRSHHRLNGNRISNLFIHSLPMEMITPKVISTFDRLREKGLFSRLGYSGDNDDLKRAIDSNFFDDYMITVNILDQRNLEYLPFIVNKTRLYIKRPLANAVWRKWRSQSITNSFYKTLGARRAFDTQTYRFRLQVFRDHHLLRDKELIEPFLKFAVSIPRDKYIVTGTTKVQHINDLKIQLIDKDLYSPNYFVDIVSKWKDLNLFNWQALR